MRACIFRGIIAAVALAVSVSPLALAINVQRHSVTVWDDDVWCWITYEDFKGPVTVTWTWTTPSGVVWGTTTCQIPSASTEGYSFWTE
ncbi:hypothetical protein KJ567_06535 [Candidatus Bipolaricaulota bacterium]|nr:hypothetical protein [Candidatus Bipolaricaulota bacterium]